MKFFVSLFLILFLLSQCSSKKNVMNDSVSKESNHKINFHISLTAENLSEDGSKLFSQNDEVVFLAYVVNADTSKFPELILSQYCAFDSVKRSADFISDSIISPLNGSLCFVMIEIDDDKNKEQVEPVIRLNLRLINAAYLKNDGVALTGFLGDSDILGIKYVDSERANFKNENSIVVSGQHLFDEYKYVLTFRQ